MKKVLIRLFVIALSIVISPNLVDAAVGNASSNGNYNTTTITQNGKNTGVSLVAADYTVSVDGQTYHALCVDPQVNLCKQGYHKVEITNPEQAKVMSFIVNSGAGIEVKSLALRMYYIVNLNHKLCPNKDSCAKVYAFTGEQGYGLSGPNVEAARNLLQQALSSNASSDNINITKTSTNNGDGTVTVTVNFSTPVKYLGVTSTGATVNPAGALVVGSEYTTMTFIVSDLPQDSCDYSFDIQYEGPGNAFMIEPNCDNTQTMYAYLTSASNSKNTYTVNGEDICDDNAGCEARIEMPQICDDNTPATDERATYKFREGLRGSDYDIQKCVLNKDDTYGHTYKLKDTVNDYCKVSCKEEYEFHVPYKVSTENGRYFKFGMEMGGRQDCYAKLNYKKYMKDVDEKQKAIVDAYNKWVELKALATNPHTTGAEITCTYQSSCSACSVSTSTNSYGYYITVSKDLPGFSYYTYDTNTHRVKTAAGHGDASFGKAASVNGSGYSCSDDNTCSGSSQSCSPGTDGETDWNNQNYSSQASTALSKVLTAVENFHKVVDNFNKCMDGSMDGITPYAGGILNWDFVYEFAPEIKYSYNEPISEENKWITQVQGLGADMLKAKNAANIVASTERCTQGYVGENCIDPSVGYVNQTPYFSCSSAGDSLNCETGKLYNETGYRYIHKRKETSNLVEYETLKVYYSIHDTGNIIISNKTRDELEKELKVDLDIVDGLPVALSTPKGTYFYKLAFGNIGTYFDKGGKGRIFGGSDSIASQRPATTTINGDAVEGNEYACTYVVSEDKDNNKYCVKHGGDYYVCKGNKYHKDKCQISTKADVKKMIEDGDIYEGKCFDDKSGYCVKEAQSYYVCPTASYSSACTPFSTREAAIAASAENYNCCPECSVFCIGGRCIYEPSDGPNRGQALLDFRTITPSNIKPNDRELGYNWNTKKAKNNKLVAEKAKNTINEIEARVNVDVDTASDNKINSVNDYTLKVKMTPDMAAKIKEYNKKQESKGSYNNDTLTCTDYIVDKYNGNKAACTKAGYTFEDNKCKATNVFCYSSFIDNLVEGKFGGEVDAKNRADAKKASFKQYSNPGANVGTNTGNLVTNDYWTINIYNSLCVDENRNAGGTCSETNYPVIGPSWK